MVLPARHVTPDAALPPGALLPAALGLAGALLLRVAVAGSAGPASVPGGLLFAAALAAVAVLCRGTRGPGSGRSVPLSVGRGLAGAALLCLGPLLARSVHGFVPAAEGFSHWAAIVVLVAVTEEALLRGVLFRELQTGFGSGAAVAVGAVVFALLHVPLYGWHVVPLDLLVGGWLGLLRLWDGSVTTPAVAHAVADLAGWWLR